MRKKSFWDKRFPTVIGLLLLVVGIGATTYLANTGAIPFLKASPTEDPQNIRITNVTDSTFSVTYTTAAKVVGSLIVSKDTTVNTGQIVLDDRDQSTGIPAPYIIHSVTVRNLQPKTAYYFAINSGTTTYLNNNQPFTTTTGATISKDPSSEDPLSGRIILPDGSVPSESLIYVTTQGGQTLSTLVKPSGIYIIPLNTFRTEDFSDYLPFTPATTFQVLAIDPNNQSRITVSATQRNPVPTITLSDNYDFTIDTTPLASTSAVPTEFPIFALETTVQLTPEIDTPQENQTFTDSQPLLHGKALPGETVDIAIHSADTITARVTADQNGNWSYRPTAPLGPGTHTLTITTKDKYGILKTIEQTFMILQSGTQVVEAATPSATLSPTPKIFPTPTPTTQPTADITAAPTIIPTPTPTSIVQGHLTPIPQKPLPATGNSSAIATGIVGIATTVAGMILFFATRGGTL